VEKADLDIQENEMIELQRDILVSRNARDKIQVVTTRLMQEGSTFYIHRITGQYECKQTLQPIITIDKGKVKRSVYQQAELQYESILNKYKDKGYKALSELTKTKFEKISKEEMEELVQSVKTDANGEVKPMLAKIYSSCQNSVIEKPLLCSRKINGVRCLMHLSDDKVVTVSRGGKNYDVSTTKIRAFVKPILERHPDWNLDGELYKVGVHLQTISGIARTETWNDKCDILEYWIYDLAIPDLKFKDRLELLEELRKEVGDNVKIKVLHHYLTEGWGDIKKYHDEWVAEGFEGLVGRNPDKEYQFGKRNSSMVKVKEYKDAEYKIIDYQDGLRKEDFCFICETEDGKTFAAQPVANTEFRHWLHDNVDDIVDNERLATVKYFELSKDNIPQQPKITSIRDVEDYENTK
jgi:DNA ligase 1